jgi:hypothetical protein
MNNNAIILKARVGSHLYGLSTEFSDEDFLGVFIRPTREILGFFHNEETYVTKDPDCTYHEVKKFMHLVAKGNPTVLELLYVPEYKVINESGKLLVENRSFFLSNHIRDSFGGYAYQQAKKLQQREAEGLEGFNPAVKNRPAKHARHCFRLLRQGKELLETGTLNPKLSNPEEYFAIGELPTEELVAKFTEEYAIFKEAKSVLPDEPNWENLNKLLLELRGV